MVFDKKNWDKNGNTWQLPLERLPADPTRGEGTLVRLLKLNRVFSPEEVELKIIEGVPLRETNFTVKVNGYPVRPRMLSGQRIPFLEGTSFGPVIGEIVILPESPASAENLGIEIRVKGVTVRREFFGMESWGKVIARIRGEVNADFLPITSDRSGFILDAPEHRAFLQVMEKIMKETRGLLDQLSGKQERRKTSMVLKEALERVHRALTFNPDFSPFGVVPLAGEENRGLGEVGVKSKAKKKTKTETIKASLTGTTEADEKKIRVPAPQLKVATPNAVVKKLKLGKQAVTCCLDHFGESGPECFTEGTIIYLNQDHPLFQRESRNREAQILNISRLVTQEIALMKNPENPRQAFDRQSRLLRDAFREDKPGPPRPDKPHRAGRPGNAEQPK